MATNTKAVQTLENRLETLQAERDALAAALHDLEAERAAHGVSMASLLAQAERTGASEALAAAETAESRDTELQRVISRKRHALAAVASDIDAAEQDLADAERQAKQDRLVQLRRDAGKLCDSLEKNLADADAWQELERMHREARGLVVALHGDGVLIPGHESHHLLWRPPVDGLRVYFDSLARRGVGLRLATVAGLPPTLSDGINKATLPKTLREAMRLS